MKPKLKPLVGSARSNNLTIPLVTPSLPEDWLRPFAIELLQRTSGEIPLLRNACAIRDFAEILRLTHRIKGAGGTVGLDMLSKLAAQCEQSAQSLDTAAIAELLDQLAVYVASALEQIEPLSPAEMV